MMMAPVARTHASPKGMRTFQPNDIRRSYRNRGRVARTQMYTNITAETFSRNHTSGQIHGRKSKIGPRHPPRNSVTATADTVIVWRYSARKNMANLIPEYSVWYPATNSVSASGRSNGGRFVSASAAI